MSTWSFRARLGGNYTRTCARAAAGGAGAGPGLGSGFPTRPGSFRRRRAGPGRAQARARVWVPYPAWFFLNQVSRVWVASIPAPLPEPNPLRSESKPPANGCLKTVCAVVRLGGWTEQLQRFSPNRCNCWIIADENAPPGALFKRSGFSFSEK